MERLCDLLFEVSNEVRLTILQHLEEGPPTYPGSPRSWTSQTRSVADMFPASWTLS